jgi:hypothetical protein
MDDPGSSLTAPGAEAMLRYMSKSPRIKPTRLRRTDLGDTEGSRAPRGADPPTLDLYGQLFPDQLDEVADRLDAAARAAVYPLCTRAEIVPLSAG